MYLLWWIIQRSPWTWTMLFEEWIASWSFTFTAQCHIFTQLIFLYPTGLPIACPRQVLFFSQIVVNNMPIALQTFSFTEYVHYSMAFLRQVIRWVIQPDCAESFDSTVLVQKSFTTALREILGRNKSRLDKPSTKLNFPTVNCEPPGLPPAVFVHVVQSRLSSELSSSGRERASNVIGERRDANSKQELDVDKTRQDLGNSGPHDQELEFTKIERQL